MADSEKSDTTASRDESVKQCNEETNRDIIADTNRDTNRVDIRDTVITSVETTDKCCESSPQSVTQIEVKPILKRKSFDELEIQTKTLPSILKKRDSFELSSNHNKFDSNHTILKRHSLGSESDHRNPSSVLVTTTEIDISTTCRPSSSSKPLSQIHSILKHKSFDEKCIHSRDEHNVPKPILKKTLSIEDEVEKCLIINNGSNANNATHVTNSSQSNIFSIESNRTRSILKFGLEYDKSITMSKTPEVKGILKVGHKNDSKPVKSALKKSDQTIDNKSEVKSILKTESTESDERINASDTSSTTSEEDFDILSNTKTTEDNKECINNNNQNNSNKSNGNSNTTPNCSVKKNNENKRFPTNNNKLDHKRPTSCIIISTTEPILIDTETKPLKKSSGSSITERLEALKRNGAENWKKRVSKSDENTEVLLRAPHETRKRSTSIADRLSQLEDSTSKWKDRVEESDAKQFTIAAKLLETDTPVIVTPSVQRKTPTPIAFRSQKISEKLNASKSDTKPLSAQHDSQTSDTSSKKEVVVSIPKTDDEEFNSFFCNQTKPNTETNETISERTFDEISSGASILLSPQKKCVRTQRRRTVSTNPIRRLAARTDFVVKSYVESTPNENNKTNNNSIQNKPKDLTKCSGFAASALAGLASREDIKAVAGKLRNSAIMTRDLWKSYDMPNSMQNLMLIQVKGRRRAQTRLVEPNISSINSGDCYILVTKDYIFGWIGKFSNVIEKTKTLEIVNQIQENKDLCFRSTNNPIIIDYQKNSVINTKNNQMFLNQLNASQTDSISPPKPPEEDEVYEEAIIGTNMIYRVINDVLLPYDDYWGRVPRYEMLTSEEAFVFDMGSEMYVWVGKLTSNIKRKCALDSAKELWNKGYNYSECDINPFGPNCGDKGDKRPQWAWFMKVNQNMETILFKDKFLNWPSISCVVKSNSAEKCQNICSEFNLRPIDAKTLIESKVCEPDMILENAHLGRGVRWDDELEGRHISITSLDVKCWQISDYEKHELVNENMCYFYSGDTYVVRWHYRLSRVGRELKTGNISRHSMIGRDRCCYFFWHGLHTKNTEKGASALMTVELDKEKAQQVLVSEGREDPCFLNIFKGSLVVLRGKRPQNQTEDSVWKMFYITGVLPNEGCLIEVECRAQSLRSRTSFVFIKYSSQTIYVWNGSQCLKQTRDVMKRSIECLINNKSNQICLSNDNYVIKEIEEGNEDKEFWDIMESQETNCQKLYYSLIDSPLSYSYTPRLFNFSSSSGEFQFKEIVCSYRSSNHVLPYPFAQEDLYGAQQPTFFLFDNQNQIFLWESKFPFPTESSDESETHTTGSLNIRWNAERKCALDTTLAYCYEKDSEEPPNAYVICAGLEPECFCCLFPQWKHREDVAQIHIQDGRKAGEMLLIQEVLFQLRKNGSNEYKLEELRKRPLPEGLNPLCLESYLGDKDFEEVLNMSREEFYGLPTWKQRSLKQRAQLF